MKHGIYGRGAIRDACLAGYHDGKTKGKGAPDRLHMNHPLFPYWWRALCAAVDTRTWGSQQVYEFCIGKRK